MDAPKWIRTPIKKGDLNCKATHNLHQKQFNILNDEYWKFLIENNPSYTTTNFAEVCLDIAFTKVNSVLFLISWPSFRKNKLLQQLIPSKQ